MPFVSTVLSDAEIPLYWEPYRATLRCEAVNFVPKTNCPTRTEVRV